MWIHVSDVYCEFPKPTWHKRLLLQRAAVEGAAALDQWNRLKRMKVQGLSGICETSWVTNADLASLASGAEPPAGNAPAAAADDIQKELETAQLHHALY